MKIGASLCFAYTRLAAPRYRESAHFEHAHAWTNPESLANQLLCRLAASGYEAIETTGCEQIAHRVVELPPDPLPLPWQMLSQGLPRIWH